MFKIEVQQSVVDKSEQHERQSAPDDFPINLAFRLAPLPLFRQRKRERNPRDKQKERENRVVMRQSVPLYVVHLFGYRLKKRSRAQRRQRDEQRSPSHNEKHVESPKRIQRKQPSGLFLCVHETVFNYRFLFFLSIHFLRKKVSFIFHSMKLLFLRQETFVSLRGN